MFVRAVAASRRPQQRPQKRMTSLHQALVDAGISICQRVLFACTDIYIYIYIYIYGYG